MPIEVMSLCKGPSNKQFLKSLTWLMHSKGKLYVMSKYIFRVKNLVYFHFPMLSFILNRELTANNQYKKLIIVPNLKNTP